MCRIRRAGSTLVYATVVAFALASFIALGVDWGRVQVTKNELRSAADAAARYGAAGLQNDLDGVSAAYANATASVRQNTANGRPITFDASQDVEIGTWSTSARAFTSTTDLDVANAVRVTLRCTAARGSAVPMTFLAVLGRRSNDVTAVSVAMIDYSGIAGAAGHGRYEYFIPATSNPWLAGMKSGSTASTANAHRNTDYAGTPMTDDGQTKTMVKGIGSVIGGSTDPDSAEANYAAWGDYANKKASPIQGGGITVSGGSPMTFDGINGGATNAAGMATVDADGGSAVWNVPVEANRATICGNNGTPNVGAENGIANVHAPINSTIGIFLDDNKPTKNATPPALDFSTAASRDFNTLGPQLKQPFFIGDGRTSTGEVQQFIPPAGATRLFIGTMDEYEWSNNVGGFYVTAHLKGRIVTVK